MSLGILGVDEMGVVGGHDLYAMFAGEIYEDGIDLFLFDVCLAVAAGSVCLMTL